MRCASKDARNLGYGLTLAAACAVKADISDSTATDHGTVGYAEIDAVIDRFQDRYLERDVGIDTLLTRIDAAGLESWMGPSAARSRSVSS